MVYHTYLKYAVYVAGVPGRSKSLRIVIIICVSCLSLIPDPSAALNLDAAALQRPHHVRTVQRFICNC
jgi:hypothetical protein